MRRWKSSGRPSRSFGVELERAHVARDVLVELLAELDQLLAQRLDAGARRLVLVDAGAAGSRAASSRRSSGSPRRRRRRRSRPAVVDAAVERQLGGERADLLLAGVGGVAHGGVRVGFAAQARARVGSAEHLVASVVGCPGPVARLVGEALRRHAGPARWPCRRGRLSRKSLGADGQQRGELPTGRRPGPGCSVGTGPGPRQAATGYICKVVPSVSVGWPAIVHPAKESVAPWQRFSPGRL